MASICLRYFWLTFKSESIVLTNEVFKRLLGTSTPVAFLNMIFDCMICCSFYVCLFVCWFCCSCFFLVCFIFFLFGCFYSWLSISPVILITNRLSKGHKFHFAPWALWIKRVSKSVIHQVAGSANKESVGLGPLDSLICQSVSFLRQPLFRCFSSISTRLFPIVGLN